MPKPRQPRRYGGTIALAAAAFIAGGSMLALIGAGYLALRGAL